MSSLDLTGSHHSLGQTFYFVVYGFFQSKMSWLGSKKNTANSNFFNLEYFMLGRKKKIKL